MSYEWLETHLQERLHNRAWLAPCMDGRQQAFPYRVDPRGRGHVIEGRRCTPMTPSRLLPDCKGETAPTYLINIPSIAWSPDLVKLIQQEGFRKDAATSISLTKKRVAVVIGLNRYASLDKSKNTHFLSQVRSIVPVHGVACRLFGFLWEPEWSTSHYHPHLYTSSKCYQLLKALNPTVATNLLSLIENSSILRPQIPYQQIRETLKNSPETCAFADHFQQYAPGSCTYFSVMDDDLTSLRQRVGLLTQVDLAVTQFSQPPVITFGYGVNVPSRPLLKLGVTMDMRVRAAMNAQLPYAPYFPEPACFFCMKEPGKENFLLQLTFLGRGTALESRRLIESGRRQGLFGSTPLFVEGGEPLMRIPIRMLTQKNGRLQSFQYKQKQFLQGLRGIPQTHAKPKQWADNVYSALDFSTPLVTDATTPMMHLFSVYDPISRMFALPGAYSTRHFDTVMNNYDAPLSEGLNNLRATARTKLWSLGMKKEMIDQVESAAIASGKAIYATLRAHETAMTP